MRRGCVRVVVIAVVVVTCHNITQSLLREYGEGVSTSKLHAYIHSTSTPPTSTQFIVKIYGEFNANINWEMQDDGNVVRTLLVRGVSM